MIDEPGMKTDDGSVFALRQRYLLQQLNLNPALAERLIGMTGPTWAVATFRCHLTNKRHQRCRTCFENRIRRIIDIRPVNLDQLILEMAKEGLLPPDPNGATEFMVTRDVPRILSALLFLAQRY